MSDNEPKPMEIDPNAPEGQVQETQSPSPGPGSLGQGGVISDTVWETACAAWINDRVRNSPIAGATEAWNHLMGALPALRAALETELGKKE
jgi:hypothetical protein